MNKLFNFTQVKGKWHKFPYFNLGGGAKLYKNFAQKLLAASLCAAVVLLGTPVTAFAEGEPDKFITAATANHWGRSNLRAYLNGVKKVDNTLPIDTTTSGSNATDYASQFSDAEYALVKPFKYHTNVFVENTQTGVVTNYAATDRFWLPSGNYSSNQVLSWGATDVSLDSHYAGNFDSAHAIPISYWPAGAGLFPWLRSPYFDDGGGALGTSRGGSVGGNVVDGRYAAAAAFKLDLSSVIFASAASAASLVPASAESGSRRFDIQGSSGFGKKFSDKLPDYGMYLKSGAGESVTFVPSDPLTYDSTAETLTVPYTGGVAGQFVVVHAFKQFSADATSGDLVAGTTSYGAATKLSAGANSSTIDVSAWGLSSLDGYTIKVWMEDGSGGSSLAAATAPVTFVGQADGSIKQVTDDSEAKNQRVFAMTADLQTSWGDLQALRDDDETAYNNVIAGKGQDGTDGKSSNSVTGLNPTNQKIYFGTKDGAPLEFWIAGRETYAGDPTVLDGDGTIDSNGEIMTLYQAKSVEIRPFNARPSNYKAVPTLTLSDSQSVEYTGSKQGPGIASYTFAGTDLGQPASVSYYSRKQASSANWKAGLPTDAGTYEVRGVVDSTDDYETATSEPMTFTIKPAVPTYSAPNLASQEIVYGSKLSQVPLDQAALGKPRFSGGDISGTWSWVNDSQSVGNVGTNNFTAKFTPTDEADKTNFDWSSLSGYDANLDALTVEVPVTVQPLPVGVSSITLSDTEFTYDGAERTPTITITANNTQLNAGSDYTVEYIGDKVSAGKQPIKIKFQGNYASDADNDGAADSPDQGVTTSYKIKPAQLTVDSITVASKTYDGKNDATVTKVQFAGLGTPPEGTQETLELGTDFTVSNAKFADANVGTDKQVTATITLTSTKANNYTFADDGSVKNEITVTKGTNAEISAFDISSAAVELADSPLTYTGTALEPTVNSVKVTLDGTADTTLAKDTDYTVAYTNNTNAGTATVTITGTGNFEGEKSANFTISQKSLTGAYIAVDPSEVTFNGATLKPGVTVKLDGFSSPLDKNTDYTVSYKDNINAGNATVTIKGTGNFEGEKSANFTISQKSLTGAEITIDPSSMVYTGKQLKPKITSVIVDGITVPSAAYAMTVSDATTAGQEVTVTLAAKSDSNFKGSASTTFTITKAAPGTSDLKPTPTLEATYGQTLGDITAGLANAIGSFLGVDDQELEGVWAWEKADATTVGDVGKNAFTAIFKPTDTSNYAWTTLDGWDADKEALVVDVAVNVSVDTSKWGDAQKRDVDGKTQYVESAGKTSIEMAEGNLSAGDVLWLLEESGGTHAWYGIDLSSGAFDLDKGLRLYVQWLSPGDDGYDEVYAQLDDAQKARVEDDNGWIFLIGVEDPDGNKVQPAHPVKVYVQIGDDWDVDDLNAYYITSGADETVPVDYLMIDYPDGTDIFGIMSLSHFSPYFIFDEFTDEEKAALELKPEDGNNQPTDKPNSSGTDLPGTGDISTELLISGLAIVLVSSLGVMLRLITNKKKFEE